MNNIEIEEKLAQNGFTGKDIAAMRQYLGKDGATYPSLLGELRGRFVVSCVLLAILTFVWIFYIFNGDKAEVLSFSFTMLIAIPVFYFMTPLKLGFKAFRFKNKI